MRKTFLILNGIDMHFIRKDSIDEARQVAINICDHSKEIIVREVDFSPICGMVSQFAKVGHSEDYLVNHLITH